MSNLKIRYFSMFSGIGGYEIGIKQACNNQYAHLGKESEQEERTQGRLRDTEKPGALLCDRDNPSLCVGIKQAIQNARPIQQESSEYMPVPDRSLPQHNQSDGDWECIGFSEIDRYAIEIYHKHFPTHKNYGDATKINPDELPDFDMLCGGFPCQSFSLAGKRQGFQDTRGTLFHEILRIAKAKRPRILFLENVKGLLSADDGRCFATIISSLDELGYDVEWQVLNSKYFGVPQNRERVFIIGHLRGTSSRQIFPLRQSNKNDSEERGIKQTNQPSHAGYRYYGVDGIAPSIRSRARDDSHSSPKIMATQLLNLGMNGRRQKSDNEPSFTLDSWGSQGVEMDSRIRRLTPIECERLQGFPDNWTLGVSDAQRYKQCGNAVTVNVISEIAKELMED